MLQFSKYHGAGNDFIIINNVIEASPVDMSPTKVTELCDRHTGIGADGVITLEPPRSHSDKFHMVYRNSGDGTETFCGNGARCAVSAYLELTKSEAVKISFSAFDGPHFAEKKDKQVSVKMSDVSSVITEESDSKELASSNYLIAPKCFVMDTGCPHHISSVEDKSTLTNFDICSYGKRVRYSDRFVENGINVNVYAPIDATTIFVRTYERGVEDETLSCGTGVTACALAFLLSKDTIASGEARVDIHTLGGSFTVSARPTLDGFCNIMLAGPTKHVFDGIIR